MGEKIVCQTTLSSKNRRVNTKKSLIIKVRYILFKKIKVRYIRKQLISNLCITTTKENKCLTAKSNASNGS